MQDAVTGDGQRRRRQNNQDGARHDELQQRRSRLIEGFPAAVDAILRHWSLTSISDFGYGCTCSVASLVTSGIGFCCESLALTCTIDRLEFPCASAFITIPINVPLPLTPELLGCRVAEIIACPRSLSTRCTMAISCVPPERNPPCRTSSTLITAGLYCNSSGIENRSFTFSTTTPRVVVCPAFNTSDCGSKCTRAVDAPCC